MRKITKKTTVSSLSTTALSVAIFFIQFLYEGWTDDGWQPMLNGWGYALLAIAGASLVIFLINLTRKELGKPEWLEITQARLPDVLLLEYTFNEFMKMTYKLSRDSYLVNPINYGLGEEVRFKDIGIFSRLVKNNILYQRMKNDSDDISEKIELLHDLTERLDNKKLKKLVTKSLEQEHKIRSRKIINRLYRINYPHLNFNEELLLKKERDFSMTLKGLYKHINHMKRGEDID